MATQNTTFVPAAIEVINQVSGSYSAPFWDGLLAVTESLDTVRAAKAAIEALHSEKKYTVAYHLILALYDWQLLKFPWPSLNSNLTRKVWSSLSANSYWTLRT